MSNARSPEKTIVFWDTKGCPRSENLTNVDFSRNVLNALEGIGNFRGIGNFGRVSFRAYGGDELYEHEDLLNEIFRCNVIEGVLEKILVDMLGYAIRHPLKSLGFVLFLGDVSTQLYFISTIQYLKSRGYTVLLAQPQKVTAEFGSEDWIAQALTAGGELTNTIDA